MQALRNGEVLPSAQVFLFSPDLSKILEEMVLQEFDKYEPRDSWTDDILARFKKHPSIKHKQPGDLPSGKTIKVHMRGLKSRIKKQRDGRNPLPKDVVKLLEEWIEEDTSATKEVLLERVKQQLLPPPQQPGQPPVHRLVDNNGCGDGADNGQNDQQQQQEEEEEEPWSLPSDEIVLEKIRAIQDAAKTRRATFPKEIARRLEEWLIAEPLATPDELLARLKQEGLSTIVTTNLPTDKRIKQKVGFIRSELKHKWDLEHPLPQRCYALLKAWIGNNTDTPAQILLDRLMLDPSMDQEELAALPSLEVCLKKIEVLREKEQQQQRAFPKDAGALLEQWLLLDKTVNNDTLIERLRRDPTVSQANLLPLDDKRIRKKLEHIRHKLKGKQK